MGKKESSKLSLIKVTVDKNYKNSLLTKFTNEMEKNLIDEEK